MNQEKKFPSQLRTIIEDGFGSMRDSNPRKMTFQGKTASQEQKWLLTKPWLF